MNAKKDKTNALHSIAHAWHLCIGQLSHVLSTKMATLKLKQQAIQKIIPILLKGYHLAVEHHLMTDEINLNLLKRVENIQNLNEQILPMFEMLEQISHYTRQTVNLDFMTIPPLSAQHCLNNLMTTQPFDKNAQHNFIQIDSSQNFNLKCSALFFDAAIHHFLTAAWQRAITSNVGDIRIWVSSNKDGYYLFNIQETNQVWTPEQFLSFFDRFLFEYEDKTLPGLGFCRLAILYIGGDIVCHEVQDGVLFQILIPKD